MKSVHGLILLFAASLLLSCSSDRFEGVDSSDVVRMTIVAEQTRTHLAASGTVAEWDAAGEYLQVFQTANGATTSVQSGEGVVAGDGRAQFAVEFETVAASNYTYYALYPAASYVATADVAEGYIGVNLPATQYSTGDGVASFDAKADMLVSMVVNSTTQSESLAMRFKRPVAVGRLSLAGFAAEDVVQSVTLVAEGKQLAGEFAVEVQSGEVYGADNVSNNTITIDYGAGVAAATPIYFTTLPNSFVEGDTLSVSVTTTKGTYAREITIPAGRTLNFVAGDITEFAVNIDTTPTPPASGFAAMAGTWHLKEWCGSTTFDFDIYLDIDAEGGVTLWQRLGSLGWECFESEATIDASVISGVYSDSTPWSASYNFTLEGDTMVWERTDDALDISVYERAELPSNLTRCGGEGCGYRHL